MTGSVDADSLVDEAIAALGSLVDREHEMGTPIPSEIDRCAIRLAASYLALPGWQQRGIRGLVSGRELQVLIAVSARLATLAVRANDPEALRAALLLHAIEDFRFDERENVRVLALIHDARRRVGLSKEAVWEGVREAFSEEGRTTLDYYPDASAESMGCKGVYVDGQFSYVPTEKKTSGR